MINIKNILEYKKLIQTTNLQQDYQAQTKLFRSIRIALKKEFPKYEFTGNIVENNMDYAYFQFTNELLKSKGLKFVLVFLYKEFRYEIWLSGYNRKIQSDYFNKFENIKLKYILTTDPNRTDYIVRGQIAVDYSNVDKIVGDIKLGSSKFINDIEKLLS